jgi:hypothetical protein
MDGGRVSAELVHALSTKLDREAWDRAWLADAYEGVQQISFLDDEIRRQVGDRLATVVVNWPRIVVDSLEERLDVEGFRAGGERADEGLWNLWQSCDLDEWSQMGHLEALLYKQSYAIAWKDRDGLRVSVESSAEVAVQSLPGRSRELSAALKRWHDGSKWRAALYLPDRVETYAADGDPSRPAPRNALLWVPDAPVVRHSAGVVPVATFTNRPRLDALAGRSEIADVIPLAQAVNKLATDMMVTSEYHAMPRRWATGIQVPADGAERERLQAEAAAYWEQATKSKTWLAGQGVSFGQFATADLSNFVNAIGMLTGQIAAIAGLPPHYLGVNGSDSNPASADAIRSAEASLVKRAKRKQRQFGGSWERIMRVAKALDLNTSVDALPEQYARIETIWRDPETPTVAQSADAAVKLTQGDTPVITPETAQEVYLGFSPEQIAQDQQRRVDSAAALAMAPVRAQIAEAERLQTTQGLSQNAALAAVGLLQAAAANRTDGNTAA